MTVLASRSWHLPTLIVPGTPKWSPIWYRTGSTLVVQCVDVLMPYIYGPPTPKQIPKKLFHDKCNRFWFTNSWFLVVESWMASYLLWPYARPPHWLVIRKVVHGREIICLTQLVWILPQIQAVHIKNPTSMAIKLRF